VPPSVPVRMWRLRHVRPVWLGTLASALLRVYFGVRGSFGQTYGPLAGIIAGLLWSPLTSIALLYGGAVGAQLEAVRAGSSAPRDPRKARASQTDVGDGHALSSHSSSSHVRQ
jgi:hypothetical protein